MSTITGSETPPVATQEDVRCPSAFVVYTPSAATMQAVDDHVKGQKIDASKLGWLTEELRQQIALLRPRVGSGEDIDINENEGIVLNTNRLSEVFRSAFPPGRIFSRFIKFMPWPRSLATNGVST